MQARLRASIILQNHPGRESLLLLPEGDSGPVVSPALAAVKKILQKQPDSKLCLVTPSDA